MPSLQRSLGAEAPGHQKVQPGAVEEQFEKKLEQLEDQLEEHAQDAAAHGEVEKVKETGGGGQAPAGFYPQICGQGNRSHVENGRYVSIISKVRLLST